MQRFTSDCFDMNQSNSMKADQVGTSAHVPGPGDGGVIVQEVNLS